MGSEQPVADLVEHLLALYGERRDAGRAGQPGAGDVAFEAVEVELERLELELRRRGLECARLDDEHGDQTGEVVVARREVGGRGPQAAAQVRGGLARRGRGEV